MKGFEEDGVYWNGSRDDLERWKHYKKQKAIAFVERGYSVAWYPDGDNWMEVYLPQRVHAREPEVRASVKFFNAPSQHGINGGRVSKLTIQVREMDQMAKALGQPYEASFTLYNYDRGPDFDVLFERPEAMTLYEDVVRGLN